MERWLAAQIIRQKIVNSGTHMLGALIHLAYMQILKPQLCMPMSMTAQAVYLKETKHFSSTQQMATSRTLALFPPP